MKLCYLINNNDITIIDDVFVDCRKSTKYYLESIRNFYCYLTGFDLEVSFYLDDSIPALSISQSKKIRFRTFLITLSDVAMYLYFPHEVFHQIIGNEVRFNGVGRLWMLESFTEYLQLLYIKHVNYKLYIKQILFYMNRYKEYRIYDIPIPSIDNSTDDQSIKACIESRGILIFLIFFHKIEDYKIRYLLMHMVSTKNVSLSIFLELCKEIGVNSQKLYKEINCIGDMEYLKMQISEVINV